MRERLKSYWPVFKTAATGFSDDQVSTLSGALAYSTVFSIAPLLMITIAIAGLVFGTEASQGQIFNSLQGLVGQNGAEGIQAMMKGAAQKPHAGIVATVLGVLTLLIGASSVFAQLQTSLNLIWKVKPLPGKSILTILRQRFLSFAMIVVIAFLLLVSLVVSAALSALGKFLGSALPGGEVFWHIVNIVVSFGIITALFASVFKILPDVNLRWRDAFVGAIITSLLFTIGRTLIGLYLGKSSVASAYGAAGSLVIVLLWVYYSSVIVFFGAELTRAYVEKCGHKVTAKKGAKLNIAVQAIDTQNQQAA